MSSDPVFYIVASRGEAVMQFSANPSYLGFLLVISPNRKT